MDSPVCHPSSGLVLESGLEIRTMTLSLYSSGLFSRSYLDANFSFWNLSDHGTSPYNSGHSKGKLFVFPCEMVLSLVLCDRQVGNWRRVNSCNGTCILLSGWTIVPYVWSARHCLPSCLSRIKKVVHFQDGTL